MNFKHRLSKRLALVAASGVVLAGVTFACTEDRTVSAPSGPSFVTSGGPTNECALAQPEWIWCDDFEQNRLTSYYDYNPGGGNFVRAAGVGANGSAAMRVRWAKTGQVSAGALHVAFGKTPRATIRPVDAGTATYRQIFWRVYVKNQVGWVGGAGGRLSRATSLASPSQAQAMIARVWSSTSPDPNHLLIQALSGTDSDGNVQGPVRNLGASPSASALFDANGAGQWYCVEARVRLNNAGRSNGVFKLWVNGVVEAEDTGLNWVGSFDDYGINVVSLQNYWDAGAPKPQERYLDNLVVSTARIGCGEGSVPPAPDSVAAVSVEPSAPNITPGQVVQLTATLTDTAGDIITGRTVTWASSEPSVATVDSTGRVTGVLAGNATITATSEGKSGSATVTVTAPSPLPVASVAVTPATATVTVAGTTPFVATTRDSAGAVLTGRVITWSSTNTGIATVTAAGVARGVAVGSASIIATSEGKADTSVVTVILTPVASVTVTPATASTTVGGTVAFTATTRDSAGTILTGRVIVWSSTNAGVATVNTTGLATGVAAGSASIIATSGTKADTSALTVTATPPPGALADPTLLPRATGQHPVAGTYGRNLAAGLTYVDPNSGATVLKLTSASVPASNGGMYHGYSEGGPNISQPWTGTDGLVYYTAKVGGWLVDIRYSTLTSLNWRRVNYSGEIGFAFSLNPATPRIAYLANGKRIDRYNTGTNAIENTGRFPWNIAAAGSSADWLQSQMNDTWLVAMLQSNHTIVAFRTSDGFERAITEGAAGVTIDEPHLDREFPVVYLSVSGAGQNKVALLETGTYINPRDVQNPANGEFVNGDDHGSPMRGKIVALTWMANGFMQVDRTGQVAMTGARNPSPTDWSGDWHQASQWVYNNPSEYFVVDQWADPGAYPIYRGMVGFVSLAGDVRLIAATDATGTSYTDGGQPHPTLAPDGKFVMWVSNMNGSGRYDTFIARTPVR